MEIQIIQPTPKKVVQTDTNNQAIKVTEDNEEGEEKFRKLGSILKENKNIVVHGKPPTKKSMSTASNNLCTVFHNK